MNTDFFKTLSRSLHVRGRASASFLNLSDSEESSAGVRVAPPELASLSTIDHGSAGALLPTSHFDVTGFEIDSDTTLGSDDAALPALPALDDTPISASIVHTLEHKASLAHIPSFGFLMDSMLQGESLLHTGKKPIPVFVGADNTRALTSADDDEVTTVVETPIIIEHEFPPTSRAFFVAEFERALIERESIQQQREIRRQLHADVKAVLRQQQADACNPVTQAALREKQERRCARIQ